ncbi:carbohydrate ABC transporter permease [Egicoccus halophilus]|uniref:Sugar ABC transporter permease n=1 Tax=Egicoccus halophilus TaxID=1670830 RepID=A0A8J3EV39_9ACTN|nr:sugar ABC transporter permease [Egicoccus halophilus]GGI08410.1 sugar ABC transporter permease [Egicoccus halophilus]
MSTSPDTVGQRRGDSAAAPSGAARTGSGGGALTGPPTRRRRPRGPRLARLQRTFDRRLLPPLLLAPALLIIFGLVGYPVLRTFWLSFHDAGLAAMVSGEMAFVGIDNYVTIVTDAHYRRVFLVTAVFGLACVIGTMVLGVGVALLLNRPFRGRILLGVLVLLPWAMPRVAAATIWQWMFHDQYGVVNWLLTTLGMTQFEGFAWFISPLRAFVAIGVVVVWQSFPFVALSILAALQSIPTDVVEAARLDGATATQRLRHITLPMIKPVLVVMVIISTIWNFKVFDQVFIMTEGGPARSTEVLSIATWREAFTRLDFGLASALAIAMFLILTLVTVVYVRAIRDDEELR